MSQTQPFLSIITFLRFPRFLSLEKGRIPKSHHQFFSTSKHLPIFSLGYPNARASSSDSRAGSHTGPFWELRRRRIKSHPSIHSSIYHHPLPPIRIISVALLLSLSLLLLLSPRLHHQHQHRVKPISTLRSLSKRSAFQKKRLILLSRLSHPLSHSCLQAVSPREPFRLPIVGKQRTQTRLVCGGGVKLPTPKKKSSPSLVSNQSVGDDKVLPVSFLLGCIASIRERLVFDYCLALFCSHLI